MGYLYNTIGKNRLIGLRKKAWEEPGIVEHSPRSPDTNVCDYFSKLPDIKFVAIRFDKRLLKYLFSMA